MVKPDKFALHAGVENDIARPIVGVSIHVFGADRARLVNVKLLGVNRDWLVLKSCVEAAHLGCH